MGMNHAFKMAHFLSRAYRRFSSFRMIFSLDWSTLARGVDKSWLLIIETCGDFDQNYSYLYFLSLNRFSFDPYNFSTFSSHYLSRYCSLVMIFYRLGSSSVLFLTAATTSLLLRVNAAKYSFLASFSIL